VREPGLATGPVVLTEPRMLAVPADHSLARRSAISVEDMAEETLLEAPCSLPDYRYDQDHPPRTPAGRAIRLGQRAETFQEILTLVAAARGVFPLGAQAAEYHARPDVTYVPFADAPPLQWATVWNVAATTSRIRAFNAAVDELARAQAAA
jgi:DNA-binding transcriptional LysR family regulator